MYFLVSEQCVFIVVKGNVFFIVDIELTGLWRQFRSL